MQRRSGKESFSTKHSDMPTIEHAFLKVLCNSEITYYIKTWALECQRRLTRNPRQKKK